MSDDIVIIAEEEFDALNDDTFGGDGAAGLEEWDEDTMMARYLAKFWPIPPKNLKGLKPTLKFLLFSGLPPTTEVFLLGPATTFWSSSLAATSIWKGAWSQRALNQRRWKDRSWTTNVSISMGLAKRYLKSC